MLVEWKFNKADGMISISTTVAHILILLLDIGLVPDVASSQVVAKSYYAQ